MRRTVLRAAAAACLLVAACGPRTLSSGAVPFPSGKPAFAAPGGAPARELPAAPEPVRLVVLDFPWCSACADAWGAVRLASREVAGGSVRVFRILFDRERLFDGSGVREVPPLRPAPAVDAGAFPVTTLVAFPSAFRQEYRVEQVPVLLLLDGEGRIAQRWSGYAPSLSAELSAGINRLLTAASPRPGT